MNGWEIVAALSGAITGAGSLIISIIVLNRRQQVDVSISKDMVDRRTFEDHVDTNNATHREIFSKIGGVERGANGALEVKMTQLWNEVSGQGKSIAGLQTQSELQNQSLASLQSDIKTILGRLPRRNHEG